MALFPLHNYFIYDSEIKAVSEFIASENDGGIYEVLRVIDGVALFVEEHFERFFYSAEMAGINTNLKVTKLRDVLKLLISRNKVENGNVLISFKDHLKAFYIPHKYPTPEAYKNGVRCGILHAERKNPNAKVFQTSVRQKANELIASNNFYEVVLVDNNGLITEGSRSNLFFIRGRKIYTPKAKAVLLGITRQKTMECATQLGFEVNETDIPEIDLSKFDAVFITGTSPKILPVKSINTNIYNANNGVLQQLIEQFDTKISEYIKNAKEG